MRNDFFTLYEPRHIERFTRSLHDILTNELSTPIALEVCCSTVINGLALSRDRDLGPNAFEVGRPWSTMAALQFLAGRGFVFDPRLALEALSRLERRHVVDRRRLVEPAPRRGGASCRRTAVTIGRKEQGREAA